MPLSLTDIAELINFNYTNESRSDFGPIDNDEYWVKFANVEESTNILIRVEQ